MKEIAGSSDRKIDGDPAHISSGNESALLHAPLSVDRVMRNPKKLSCIMAVTTEVRR